MISEAGAVNAPPDIAAGNARVASERKEWSIDPHFDDEAQTELAPRLRKSTPPRVTSPAPETVIEAEDHNDEEEHVVPSPLAGAIAMVSATLSIVSCGALGILFAPVAIIAGHTALAQARRSPVHPAPGQTLGAVGMVLGYLSLAFTIVVLLLLVLFGAEWREAYFK